MNEDNTFQLLVNPPLAIAIVVASWVSSVIVSRSLFLNEMEIKNIHKDADWFVSYEESKQGKALILCQGLKIKQLENVLAVIQGEIELAEDPKEFSSDQILQSIKALIDQIPEVSHSEGYFKWVG